MVVISLFVVVIQQPIVVFVGLKISFFCIIITLFQFLTLIEKITQENKPY